MVTSAAWRLTRAAGAIVILQSRDRSEFEIASQSHSARQRPRFKLAGMRFAASGSLAARVVRSGRSLRIPDTATWPRPLLQELMHAVDVRALLMVPLRGARGAIGVLAVSSATPREFSAHDRRILTQLGQQASIAIQNARLFAAVRNHRQLLRRLSSQQFSTLEDERKRIAHELHDEMGPTLSAILINLQLLKDEGRAGGTLPTAVVETERLLTGLIDKIRELAYGLHPPMLENVGLAESVQWMIDTYFSGGRLTIDYRFSGTLEHLNGDLALALYRIAQEALTNVVKHAQARRARVRLRSSNSLIALHVRDDGRGFDTGRMERKAGFGLASMRERTEQLRGRMALRSAPGKGCRLTVSFPVEVRGARALG
jgi:signal transduction histidine kinase